MEDNEFTKLSFLADAIATDPVHFDEYVGVIERRDLPHVGLKEESAELTRALVALREVWGRVVPTNRSPTTDDVVAVAEELGKKRGKAAQLAGRILLAAAESRRLIASDIPDVTSGSGAVVAEDA